MQLDCRNCRECYQLHAGEWICGKSRTGCVRVIKGGNRTKHHAWCKNKAKRKKRKEENHEQTVYHR